MRIRDDEATKLLSEPEREPARPPAVPAGDLTRLDRGVAAGMLTRMQAGHGNASVSRMLQRDAVPAVRGKPGAALSAGEAVHRLMFKLYGADGLFDTMGQKLSEFEGDMKTQLGWYAGDKKSSSKKKTGTDAAMEAAATAAKSKAKGVVTSGVKYLAGMIPKVGGPAGTAAGLLAGVLWKEFDKIAEYDPIVTEPAFKQPHQHYIEAMDLARKHASRSLVEELTASMDEMAAGSVEDVLSMLRLVDDAIALVDARFYLDIVQGYRDIAPAKTIEPETPHAIWTGEKRGLWGGGRWVTPIKSGTIFVQFKAKTAAPRDIQIVRTLVPELPRDVMDRFDSISSSLRLGDLVETDELVMEGDVMNGWEVRLIKEAATSKLKWAESPSYSVQYLSGVAETLGHYGSEDNSKFHTGAVNVYAEIISTPLNKAKLST